MGEPTLPVRLVAARRTPDFDQGSVPEALARAHRTTVWAELRVQAGTVRYRDLEGEDRRDLRLDAGDSAVIVPGIEHHVELSPDARFHVQFFREPDAELIPGPASAPEWTDAARRSGPWEHRGRDLDTIEEITELVTRQYVDVVQDELLQPRFDFDAGFVDWQAHIGAVTDYWGHVLLYAPDYEIDVLEGHRHLHERDSFTPELFDRWLQVFHDTVDGGWVGPKASMAKKRATGMAWAMAQRLLGHGVWRPAEHG